MFEFQPGNVGCAVAVKTDLCTLNKYKFAKQMYKSNGKNVGWHVNGVGRYGRRCGFKLYRRERFNVQLWAKFYN